MCCYALLCIYALHALFSDSWKNAKFSPFYLVIKCLPELTEEQEVVKKRIE